MKHPPKPSVGRPRHVAVYEKGAQAQQNFQAAMRAIVDKKQPKPGKK
jgi:hypothetical protein